MIMTHKILHGLMDGKLETAEVETWNGKLKLILHWYECCNSTHRCCAHACSSLVCIEWDVAEVICIVQ